MNDITITFSLSLRQQERLDKLTERTKECYGFESSREAVFKKILHLEEYEHILGDLMDLYEDQLDAVEDIRKRIEETGERLRETVG